nr:MAG TPA: hypothetical protein [Caudoviricetes sp.]
MNICFRGILNTNICSIKSIYHCYIQQSIGFYCNTRCVP